MSIKNIKNIISIDCIFYLCFLSFNINAQNYYDFGFKQELNVIVYDSLGNKLNRPWEGGLNSVQFCGIDMNLDGIEDLERRRDVQILVLELAEELLLSRNKFANINEVTGLVKDRLF